MKLRKKLTISFAGICIACIVVTIYAVTGISFKVNGATVKGTISYKDTNDYNPLSRDSVTANTVSSSVMDRITTSATIYFAEDATIKSVVQYNTMIKATKGSSTARASFIGVGYRGEGTHKACSGNKNGSGTTNINW